MAEPWPSDRLLNDLYQALTGHVTIEFAGFPPDVRELMRANVRAVLQGEAAAEDGVKWAGLSDEDLKDVAISLDADWEMYTRDEDRDRVFALRESAEAEVTRRGLQPEED